ncbi:glycoside hydrolase family 31 protein, partial [Clostridium chrysemydis]
MGGLNYRETLDKRYKKYKGELRIFEGYEALNNKVTLKFNEKELTVEYINNSIVKVFLGERNEEEILTNAVILDSSKREIIKVEETNDKIIIKGEKLVTEVNKLSTEITFLDVNNNIICEDFQPSFKDEEGNIYISKVNDSLAYYGLGEKGGELNKKGTYTENYNTDDPETTDDSVMYYKTIPFYVGLKENNCHGIYFDNSFRSYYDMGKEYGDRIYFGAVGGQIRYYFILGDDIKDVVKEYTSLTGKMDMPPLWSLGYQQNRFSYFSKEEVYDLVNTFKENEIPLDVIYLDIDYMDGFRVMTFKTPNFENAKKLIKDLKDMGIKTVTILDPGVKVDENYDIYKSGKLLNHFTKKSDGETFVGAVWPGDSVFPDFSNEKCRTWWKENLKKFISENDIAGIWNDMNEPCVFNNDHKTMLESCIHNSDFGVIEHKEFHNRYGFEMSRCSFEAQRELDNNKRGFSMTRATFSG